MKRFLIVATGGAGGDLQPLVSAALAIRTRAHEIAFIGDRSVGRALTGLGLEVQVLPSELGLGPPLAGAVRAAMASTGGDIVAAGPLVEERLAQWAEEAAEPITRALSQMRPDVVVTSLFGVEVVQRAKPSRPWAVIKSTFYFRPEPAATARGGRWRTRNSLLKRYAGLLTEADLVLHATDRVFDFSFDRLPVGHHYVGPLGTWEPPMDTPVSRVGPGLVTFDRPDTFARRTHSCGPGNQTM